MTPRLTPAQLRVLRYLGAPGIDRARGRTCFGGDYVAVMRLVKMGLAEEVSFRVFRITPAGLEYLARLESGK